MAGQAVVLVVAVTILLWPFSLTYGMWGGVMLGAAGLLSRLEEDRLLLPKEDICRWALAGGTAGPTTRALHTHTESAYSGSDGWRLRAASAQLPPSR